MKIRFNTLKTPVVNKNDVDNIMFYLCFTLRWQIEKFKKKTSGLKADQVKSWNNLDDEPQIQLR